MPLKMSSGKLSYIGRYGGLTVPGTPVGAIVSIGLIILCWLAIPIARPFILGTGGLGLNRRLDSVVEAHEIKRISFISHAIHAYKTC